ncbi:MAG: hypothetical protein JWM20_23 [Patescibacteria group bacterium]|nr:hypothetical protein [Patescibacteria group bacterium]
MIRRILWDIVLLILVFMAPWWVSLCVGIGGAVLFPWYVEIVLAGAIIDAIYGGAARHWYSHLIHTGIFALLLLAIEFIKTNVIFKK